MNADIFKGYLVHVVPAILLPVALHFYDPSVTAVSLVRLGFLLALLILASRGLASIFPRENLSTRPVGIMIEHALLIGALAGGFFVVGSAFIGPASVGQDASQLLKSFATITLAVGAANLWLAFRDKRRIARHDD